MKTPFLLLLPLVFLRASGAADANTVVKLAREAPAEYAADAMIRLASTETLGHDARVKLLNEAFRRAAEAQHALRLHASITRVGSPGGFLERAYRQDLDTMSLRLRVVRQMLPLDSAKATKLFLSMARPSVPAVRCDEMVVYDPSGYYDGLGAIAKISPRDPAKLLKDRVGGLTSPAQIAPVARLLHQLDLKDADLQALTLSLAASLREISGDDRSFTYYAEVTGRAIQDLADDLNGRQVATLPLAEAYRLYLVNHLSADRCADDELLNNGPPSFYLTTGRPAETQGAAAAALFAAKIMVPPLKALSEQEMTPKSLDGFAAGVHACEDATCQNVNELARQLAFGPEGQPLTEAQHNTDGWRQTLEATLAALDGWQAGNGQADIVFREKTAVYSNLFLMSPGKSREAVARSWLGYLKRSRPTVSDRTQWLLPVSALIGRAALDPANTGLAALLRAQDDPVISLYVKLEALAPRQAEKILLLL